MIKELLVKKLETTGGGGKSKEPSINTSRRCSSGNIVGMENGDNRNQRLM